ncbi:MAG: helix-turn-helix domain-containing protein [Candidatus Korobacteraceae bacterium]
MGNVFRFADFEADRERYQLRSGSRTIKLERLPIELLFLLLEHRGKLVSREQIVARLWCDESFLDTERSINTAVRKVRRALGDDPRRPRFIETVIGKGYRFLAPLEQEHTLHEIRSDRQSAPRAGTRGGSEIRLRSFSVEATGGAPILTCDVVVSNIPLGRLPLMEVELPADVTLPLKPRDRLLLSLHGVRVTLTAKAIQALHAFSISVLQSGLQTRMTDTRRLSEESLEKTSLAGADAKTSEPPKSHLAEMP